MSRYPNGHVVPVSHDGRTENKNEEQVGGAERYGGNWTLHKHPSVHPVTSSQ